MVVVLSMVRCNPPAFIATLNAKANFVHTHCFAHVDSLAVKAPTKTVCTKMTKIQLLIFSIKCNVNHRKLFEFCKKFDMKGKALSLSCDKS